MGTFVVASGIVDPESEVRVASVGTPAKTVKNFRIATNPGWFSVAAWEKVADQVPPQGTHIIVTGKLSTRSYDKDGVKMYATEIVASSIEVIGGAAPAEDSLFD